jgi:hypothetical protein
VKKIDFGQAANTLANIGVVAGILFLVFELRQNNELLQLQAQSEQRERVNAGVELVINNPDLSELMAKDQGDLSEVERDRLIALGVRLLLNFEDLYRDVMAGRTDEEEAIRRLRAVWWREKLNYGVPLAWDTYKARSAPEFIQWMEEKVIDSSQAEQ